MKHRAFKTKLLGLRNLSTLLEATFNRPTNISFSSSSPGRAFISSTASLSGQCVNDSMNTGRKKLVVLGTGWGGYSVVHKANKKLYDVIVVSPRNHFLFTPLLASTTVGTLEFRSIIEPIRNSGFRDEHHFHHSCAISLDPDKQVVRCVSALDPRIGYDVPYDALVIAVGAVPNDFNIPGVREHAFFLKVGVTYDVSVLCI